MKNRKVPLRSCLITKEKCEKKDLLRIVKTPTGEVVIDPTGKLNGRGYYLKKDEEVILKAKQNNTLSKLGLQVSSEFYDEILKNI